MTTVSNRPWGVHTIRDICGSSNSLTGLPDGRYVRAVPEPYTANRVVAAWWVLLGRARAIIWPTSAELAAAMGFPERKPWPTEAERTAFAKAKSAHLPMPSKDGTSISDGDIAAMRAAFAKRFNEDQPRTETLMAVAHIGYRMALRDMASTPEVKP